MLARKRVVHAASWTNGSDVFEVEGGTAISAKPVVTLLIRNAEQVVTAENLADPPGTKRWHPLKVIPGGAVACAGDTIVAVGPTDEVTARVELAPNATVLDVVGRVVTPGLVDAHTHPVFAGSRLDEFEMRLQGRSYEEIAAAGGGIRSTVRAVRQASEEELVRQALPRLDDFLALGTTTLEAKSGYGLSTESELRMLRAIRRLNALHPVDLVPTFLGAHEIPDEYRDRRSDYLQLVTDEMLPAVREEGLAEFCDVFCERGVYSVEEARTVLGRAKALGFGLKIHAEQLSHLGGAQLAAELGAVSADHLDWCDENDLDALQQAGVVPVVLPGAVFFLGKNLYAPARRMIDRGMPLAVSTDYNPGSCPTPSLPMAGTLACLRQGLLPSEALVASTLGGAFALNRERQLGTLEPGKQADVVVWKVTDYRELFYHFGVARAERVVKKGEVVWHTECEVRRLPRGQGNVA